MTGRARAWWGLWVYAVATVLLVAVGACFLAWLETYRVRTDPFSEAAVAAVLWCSVALVVVSASGVFLYAAGTARARTWALVAAICLLVVVAVQLIPWYGVVADGELAARLSRWLPAALSPVFALAFARALDLDGSERRTALRLYVALVLVQLVLAVAAALTAADGRFGRRDSALAVAYPRLILEQVSMFVFLYLVLDRMGARARATAVTLAAVLVGAGAALLATTLWATASADPAFSPAVRWQPVTRGACLVIGGAGGIVWAARSAGRPA